MSYLGGMLEGAATGYLASSVAQLPAFVRRFFGKLALRRITARVASIFALHATHVLLVYGEHPGRVLYCTVLYVLHLISASQTLLSRQRT